MDDRGFIRRTYISIAITWATAMCWAFAFQKPWIALSITLGTILGTAILASFDWLVRRAFVPEARSPRRALVKFGLLKYPLYGLALYWLVRWDKISLPAFCGGIVLVHFAIIMKMLGIRLIEKHGESR